MIDQLPDPLVPPDCDLRDYKWMPLGVEQLHDARIVDVVTGDEFKAAVLLWCKSWHQVPCSSLPDDDVQLAKLAGFGRAIDEWRKVKNGALYGFVLCSDGRLYHPVIAEYALQAWSAKRKNSDNGRAGAEKRWSKQRSNTPKNGGANGGAIANDGAATLFDGAASENDSKEPIAREREKENNREQGKRDSSPNPPQRTAGEGIEMNFSQNLSEEKNTVVSLSRDGPALRPNSRALGTNPRALGTNPRALGTNPRATALALGFGEGSVSRATSRAPPSDWGDRVRERYVAEAAKERGEGQ